MKGRVPGKEERKRGGSKGRKKIKKTKGEADGARTCIHLSIEVPLREN